MSSAQDIVNDYLKMFDDGNVDNAFHSLDINRKIFLLDVISEYRLDSSLELLGNSLQYEADSLWQSGLNGLMKSDSWLVPDIIEKVMQSTDSELKVKWLQEARIAKIGELR